MWQSGGGSPKVSDLLRPWGEGTFAVETPATSINMLWSCRHWLELWIARIGIAIATASSVCLGATRSGREAEQHGPSAAGSTETKRREQMNQGHYP